MRPNPVIKNHHNGQKKIWVLGGIIVALSAVLWLVNSLSNESGWPAPTPIPNQGEGLTDTALVRLTGANLVIQSRGNITHMSDEAQYIIGLLPLIHEDDTLLDIAKLAAPSDIEQLPLTRLRNACEGLKAAATLQLLDNDILPKAVSLYMSPDSNETKHLNALFVSALAQDQIFSTAAQLIRETKSLRP